MPRGSYHLMIAYSVKKSAYLSVWDLTGNLHVTVYVTYQLIANMGTFQNMTLYKISRPYHRPRLLGCADVLINKFVVPFYQSEMLI